MLAWWDDTADRMRLFRAWATTKETYCLPLLSSLASYHGGLLPNIPYCMPFPSGNVGMT